MSRISAVLAVACITALQGCAGRQAAPPPPLESAQRESLATTATPLAGLSDDPIIARVDGRVITLRQLHKPLIEGYGLNILLNLVQLELARKEAERAGLSVSPEDIRLERQLTLDKMFHEADQADHERLFEQFLQQQRISRAEFDLVLENNAYLRKLSEPLVKDRITEESLEEAFRQLYGETVQVRHVQLANMQEVAEAKRRLASGEAFEQVASEMSRNARTAGLGGELPPFSRAAAGYPQAFKDTAFSLKEGEVSDPVVAEGAFHLIKLERRIPPKVVKFEDVKQSLRDDLQDRLVQAAIRQLRSQFAADALRTLVIDDPVLKEQYENRVEKRDAMIRDRDQIRQQLHRERQRMGATQPATEPLIEWPSTNPAADVPPAPEVARPPATGSAAAPEAADIPATVPSTQP